jgi:hypothetical protein
MYFLAGAVVSVVSIMGCNVMHVRIVVMFAALINPCQKLMVYAISVEYL